MIRKCVPKQHATFETGNGPFEGCESKRAIYEYDVQRWEYGGRLDAVQQIWIRSFPQG